MNSVKHGKTRADAAKELTDLRNMAKEAVVLRDKSSVEAINREYTARLSARGVSGNPLQGFGYMLMLQAPWSMISLFGIRGMSQHPDLFPSFIIDSPMAWCPSLALSDPLGVVPLLSAAMVALSSTQLPKGTSSAPGPSISDRDRLYISYAVRGACFTFLPLAISLPVGVYIFFIFNTCISRLVLPLVYRGYLGPVS